VKKVIKRNEGSNIMAYSPPLILRKIRIISFLVCLPLWCFMSARFFVNQHPEGERFFMCSAIVNESTELFAGSIMFVLACSFIPDIILIRFRFRRSLRRMSQEDKSLFLPPIKGLRWLLLGVGLCFIAELVHRVGCANLIR